MTALERVHARIRSATRDWVKAEELTDIRAGFDDLLCTGAPMPARFSLTEQMQAAWIGSGDSVILYCHGGGFQIGSVRSHLGLVSRLAAAAQARALFPEYRLAPEHRYPAAADDITAAYRWLLAQGIAAHSIAIVGDSAGGALALSCAIAGREAGLNLPGCIVLISPWLDLSMQGDSYETRADQDIFSQPAQLKSMARTYLARQVAPEDPRVSPVFADLSGLPPVLVQAGTADITYDDSVLLAERVAAAGGQCQIQAWQGMCHHFQVFEELPEAGEALALAGAFVAEHTGGERPART